MSAMAGTSLEVTRPMELMPPRMTRPTSAASTTPKTKAAPSLPRKPSSPPVMLRNCAKVWLAWNMLPPATPKKKIATAKMPVRIVPTQVTFSLENATLR